MPGSSLISTGPVIAPEFARRIAARSVQLEPPLPKQPLVLVLSALEPTISVVL